MAQKRNRAGEMQPYVPAGNGDASGEFTNSEGNNKNFDGGKPNNKNQKTESKGKIRFDDGFYEEEDTETSTKEEPSNNNRIRSVVSKLQSGAKRLFKYEDDEDDEGEFFMELAQELSDGLLNAIRNKNQKDINAIEQDLAMLKKEAPEFFWTSEFDKEWDDIVQEHYDEYWSEHPKASKNSALAKNIAQGLGVKKEEPKTKVSKTPKTPSNKNRRQKPKAPQAVKGNRVNYEDDVIKVYLDGKEWYKGIVDDFDMMTDKEILDKVKWTGAQYEGKYKGKDIVIHNLDGLVLSK